MVLLNSIRPMFGLFIVILFFLFYNPVHVLSQKIHIFSSGSSNNSFEDNFVEIGFEENATLGLNVDLGEELVNEKQTTRNIYSIHRNEESNECGKNIEEASVFFSENLALDRDLRSYSSNDIFLESFYQIKVAGTDVDELVIVQPDDREIDQVIDYVGFIYDCGNDNERFQFAHIESMSSFLVTTLTFTFDTSATEDRISSVIIKFEDDLFTSSYSKFENVELDVFPNFVIDKINWVDPQPNSVMNVAVFDMLGRLQSIGESISDSSFNVGSLSAGQYVLQLRNAKNGKIYVARFQKIIK